MKISFEEAKKILEEINHLQFENINNDKYWKYIRLYKDLWWDIYFAEQFEYEYVELEKSLYERLSKLMILKGVINNEE